MYLDFLSSIKVKNTCATLISGTTICGVNACATNSVCSSIICATTCIKTPLLSGTTVCGVNICTTSSACSPIVCATSCVRSPLITGTTICTAGNIYLSGAASRFICIAGSAPSACITIIPGQTASGIGGNLILCGGETVTGTGGDVIINSGAGTTPGTVYIKCSNNTKLNTTSTGICVTGVADASTCVTSPIVCASNCMCVANKLNVGNPSITTRDLNVGANGIVNMGNFQMPNDRSFFFGAGALSDSGTRFKLFTINCHAYLDFYDCLIIRSGPVSSPDVAYITSGGTICACESFRSPIVCGTSCFIGTTVKLTYSSASNDAMVINNTNTGGHCWFVGDGAGSSPGTFGIYNATDACAPLTITSTGIVTAYTCFAGSGAGLTGTANSLSIGGTANNATCLGGICYCMFVYGGTCTGSQTATAGTYNPYETPMWKSGFWEVTSSPWTPTTDWYWGLTAAHTSNGPAYNYSLNLIGRGTGSGAGNAFYLRTVGGGTPSAWRRVWTDGDACIGATCLNGTTCVVSPKYYSVRSSGSAVLPVLQFGDTLGGACTDNVSIGNNGGSDLIFHTNGADRGRFSAAGRFTSCASISEDIVSHFVNTSSTGYGAIVTAGSGTRYILQLRDYATNIKQTFFADGNATFAACGTAIDWIATSDCRLKTCIKPITCGLSTVLKLQGVNYQMCGDNACEIHLGLIAQDVQKILPEVVSHGKPSEEDAKYGITDDKLGLKYDKLTAVLVEAIKELDKKVNCLCRELNYWRNYNEPNQNNF